MKHLCIINPMAGGIKGHVDELIEEIKDFFARNHRMEYAIHVTRWKRDASGYVMRYVRNASEIVRVYSFGGGGTLFEVINGILDLPNSQVAYFPLGNDDNLLSAFGNNSRIAFKSIRNLSLSAVMSIDTILAGNHSVISNAIIGIGAISQKLGEAMLENLMIPQKTGYNLAAVFYTLIKGEIQHYHIETENDTLEGDYYGISVANICGSGGRIQAPEARFNDGYMDLFVFKQTPRKYILRVLNDYQNGLHGKWPQYISHYRCKKIRITSVTDMTISLDGEIFYDTELQLEIRPFSLNFVYPPEIDKAILYREPEKNDSPLEKSLSDIFISEEFL